MAEDAPKSIDGIVGPSIAERSHRAGEASPDAARVDDPDGLQSSQDIGEARDVLADDPRPLTRCQGPSGFAATEADRRWIDAVLDDLEGRSPATKEALAKALLEHSVTSVGHVSGLKLEARQSAKKEHSTCDQSTDPSAPHVSGTTTFHDMTGAMTVELFAVAAGVTSLLACPTPGGHVVAANAT